ncbi:MAG TPA: FtsX-like permease family protein [Thermoanaerobaculia bacterium]|nr:FtsX-like permease family protein [Thermoanaerobaculia bacterium]
MNRPRLMLSRLPFPVVLALRYFRSTRRDAFTTFLSAVAVGAITVGVLALILSLAALSGFQDLLRSEILAQTPEIEVELPPGLGSAEVEAAAAAAGRVRGVEEVRTVVRGQGWVVHAGRVVPAELVGFTGPRPPAFPGVEGSGPGLYLSLTLARSWGIETGQVVEAVSPRPTLTPLGPQPRIRSVPLAGTFQGGKVAERERAALPLEVVESLFGAGRRRLLVATGSLERSLDVAPRLAAALPAGSRVATWRDLNRPLFFALRLERVFLFLGVSLVVVVAALALLADLSLIIANKRVDLGVLLTLGATPRALRRAFLWLGALLALLGTALGSALGVGLAFAFDRLRLIRLPGEVFFVDYIPFLVRPRDLALILAVTLSLALAASFYAASRAAALDPVEAMRR